MSSVRIEGVEFTVDDAAEFARRTRQYVGANPEMRIRDPEARFRDRLTGGVGRQPALTPGTALAMQVEQRVEEDGGDVKLTEDERAAASAVLDEWLQTSAAPEAARTLYRLLAPG